MGRKKKAVNINKEKFDSMSRQDKLALFNDFSQLFSYELSFIGEISRAKFHPMIAH